MELWDIVRFIGFSVCVLFLYISWKDTRKNIKELKRYNDVLSEGEKDAIHVHLHVDSEKVAKRVWHQVPRKVKEDMDA